MDRPSNRVEDKRNEARHNWHATLVRRVLQAGTMLALCAGVAAAQQNAGLVPNAKQQFLTPGGDPVALGSVEFYIPGTNTPKNTWTSPDMSVRRPNPAPLDIGGYPQPTGQIFGIGAYRQVVRDKDGNVIWDALTTTSGGGSGGGGGGQVSAGDTLRVGSILQWAGGVPPSDKWHFADGTVVTRADHPDLLQALTLPLDIACSSGSTLISGLTDTEQVSVGAAIEAPCISPGTTVTNKSATSLTLSAGMTSSQSATAVIFNWGNGNGSTTFNLPDLRGRALVGRNNMGGVASAALSAQWYGSNPNAFGAVGGNQSVTLVADNMPSLNIPVSIPSGQGSHTHGTSSTLWSGGSSNRHSGIESGTLLADVFGMSITSSTLPAMSGTATLTSPNDGVSIVQPSITVNYIIKILPEITGQGVMDIQAVLPLLSSIDPDDLVATLSIQDSGVVPGTYGGATVTPVITVDAKGIITNATTTLIAPAMSSVTNVGDWVDALPDAGTVDDADKLIMRRASDGQMIKLSPSTLITGRTDAVVYGTATINLPAGSSTVAIDRNDPATTTITLPSIAAQGLTPITIVDWSSDLDDHVITINPSGSDSIMRLAAWQVRSTSYSRGVVTLYPSTNLGGWYLQ